MMYKRYMKIIITVLILLAATSVLAEPYQRDITEPPFNPDDAYMVQVWVPIEIGQSARVDIQILNQDTIEVRNFFEGTLPKGYHKFYWDKKDNSGRFVKPGIYFYQLTVNGKSLDLNPLNISFLNGERDLIGGLDSLNNLILEVERDSTIVSVWLYNKFGRQLQPMAVDTVLMAGEHLLKWQDDWPYKYGEFVYRVVVEDYTNEIKFKRKPAGMK